MRDAVCIHENMNQNDVMLDCQVIQNFHVYVYQEKVLFAGLNYINMRAQIFRVCMKAIKARVPFLMSGESLPLNLLKRNS